STSLPPLPLKVGRGEASLAFRALAPLHRREGAAHAFHAPTEGCFSTSAGRQRRAAPSLHS
ncbi:unnamed protein product, partial [Mycena citricolor]